MFDGFHGKSILRQGARKRNERVCLQTNQQRPLEVHSQKELADPERRRRNCNVNRKSVISAL